MVPAENLMPFANVELAVAEETSSAFTLMPPVNVDVPDPPTRMVEDAWKRSLTFKVFAIVEDAVEINPVILPRESIEKIVVEAEFTILNRSAVCPVWDLRVRGVESVLVAPMVKTEFGSGEVVPIPRAEVAANNVEVPNVDTPVPKLSVPPAAVDRKIPTSALMSKRFDPVVT